jgi:hypothetical protein
VKIHFHVTESEVACSAEYAHLTHARTPPEIEVQQMFERFHVPALSVSIKRLGECDAADFAHACGEPVSHLLVSLPIRWVLLWCVE